ncbi:MAG: septal ring lytic transglycosylase RlpA family protein [Chitinophagales bacterium]
MRKLYVHVLMLAFVAFSGSALAQEVGVASFYHSYFNGKRTASGELYDETKLTAAHKTLPMGTMLKVTNLDNDKSVIVKVNDRGPFVKGRLIDLSKKAAQQLGYINTGTARVTVEVIIDQAAAPKDTATVAVAPERMMVVTEADSSEMLNYGVKIASYEDAKFAFTIAREMKAKFNLSCYVQTVKLNKGNLYRIFTGNFTSAELAEELRLQLRKAYPECYVIQYKNFR